MKLRLSMATIMLAAGLAAPASADRYEDASARGSPDAARSRDIIAQHMTPAQITETQKLAREWHEENRNE